MTLHRTTLLVLTACLLGVLIPLSPFGPGTRTAGAWTDGACPTAAGVTVVIDFQELGGGIWVRCTGVAVGSGFEALDAAGVPWTSAVRSTGFLCRIDGRPSASGTPMPDGTTLKDACQNPSPARAYWSHWIAPRGGAWCYSNLGGGARRPPEGTVEGWSFSYERTASDAPAPRYAPPARVPGAPTTSPAGECDPIVAPTTPSTTPSRPGEVRPGEVAPTTPGGSGAARPGTAPSGAAAVPGAAVPAGPSGPGVAGSAAHTDPAAAAGAPASGPSTTAGGDASAAPGSTSGSASGSDGSVTPSTIVDEHGDEVAINGESAERATPAPASTPAGVAVALVIIAALTATSAVVRRHVASVS